MTTNSQPVAGEQVKPAPTTSAGTPGADQQSAIGSHIKAFNAENPQHEDLWTRILHAVDAVRRARKERRAADKRADEARDAHLAVQAEEPDRRAPRLRQLAIAAAALALDAIACYFAAQALDYGQLETLGWAALFLAVLGGGELALDFFRDRHRRVWDMLAAGLSAFVVGLGVLRFTFLFTVGTGDPLVALVGAVLFTAATALFVLVGYWALRRAETPAASRARRRARRAAKEAAAAAEDVGRCERQREKLVDAYLVRLKANRLQGVPVSQLPRIEAALRNHLLGEDRS